MADRAYQNQAGTLTLLIPVSLVSDYCHSHVVYRQPSRASYLSLFRYVCTCPGLN